jgi:hypothetical protein
MTDISIFFLQDGVVPTDEYTNNGPELNVHLKYLFGQFPLGPSHFRSETPATIA